MRSLAWALLVCVFLPAPVHAAERHAVDVSTGDQLMEALEGAPDGTTVRLAPGVYRLPGIQRGVTLRQCGDVVDATPATVGVIVSGTDIVIQGPADGDSELITTADVGIQFRNCSDCAIKGVSILGIDPGEPGNPRALILSIDSSVRIENCALSADVSTLRGITGLASTGVSRVTIESSEIAGVAQGILLSGSTTTTIENTLISGASRDHGGPSMHVDCGASATLMRSHLENFVEGVRITGHASLACRKNIIENMGRDGVAAVEEGLGRLRIEKSVFYQCGGAGIAVRADGDQRASGNLVVATGGVQPRQSAVYVVGARADAAVRKNTLYDNTVLDESLDRDVPREIFWRVRRPWTRTYRNTPVGVNGRHHFYESAFLTRYGRWGN